MAAYASVADVRDEVVQTIQTETYVLSSATGSIATPNQITLKDVTTKALTSVKKNGVLMVGGYTYVSPNRITFSPALAENDVIELVRDVLLTDTQVTRYIGYVTNIINASLQKSYTVPFDPVPPLVNTIAINLAAAAIRRRLFDSTGKEGDRRGQLLWDEFMELLEKVADRDLLLTDADGDEVPTITHGFLIDPSGMKPIFDLNEPADIIFLDSATGVTP